MKELKEIVDGIAHSLNMTVDALVKAYPHIRAEYSWYYTCGKIQVIFSVLLLIYAIFGFIFIVSCHSRADDDNYSEESVDLLFTVYKVAFLGVGLLLGIILIATVIKGFTSPDILIIKETLNTITQGE